MEHYQDRTEAEVASAIQQERGRNNLRVLALLAFLGAMPSLFVWFLVGPGLILVVWLALFAVPSAMLFWQFEGRYHGASLEARFDGRIIRWTPVREKEELSIILDEVSHATYYKRSHLLHLTLGRPEAEKEHYLRLDHVREQGSLVRALGVRFIEDVDEWAAERRRRGWIRRS